MITENKIISESLRLLIPEEIADLTDEFVAFNKVTLTSLLEAEIGLELSQPVEGEVKENSLEEEIEQVEAIVEAPSEDHSAEEAISTFILAQRNKFKESNLKLKEKSIQDLYKKNAVTEMKTKASGEEEQKVSEDKVEKKDEKSSGEAGILVDKEHY